MIQFAKTKPSQRLELKYCEYEGCGKKFKGIAISKYCLFHRDPKNRPKKPRKVKPPVAENKIFKHDFKCHTTLIFECGLEGCENNFEVIIIPKQYVYPKYCPEHRSEFQRKNFKKTKLKP